jgi:hypothetical protein
MRTEVMSRAGWLIPLFLAAALAGCSESDPTNPTAPGAVLTLAPLTAAIPADGASRVALTAQITPQAASANRTIHFTTTAGSFAGATTKAVDVPVDTDGKAVVVLQSGSTVDTATVEASLLSYVQRATVSFTAAVPDSIVVDPGAFSLQAGLANTTTVTAVLRTANGVATQGTPVTFHAFQPNGVALGEFRSITRSDATGQATALFTAGNTTFRGKATLVARYTDPITGKVVEGRGVIQIVDPPAV